MKNCMIMGNTMPYCSKCGAELNTQAQYKAIVIGPYSYVGFYAENHGTTTIKASYHGYSDSSLIIVQLETVVVQVAENVIVVVENQENFVWITPENLEIIYWPENFIAIGSDNENIIYWPENDTSDIYGIRVEPGLEVYSENSIEFCG